MRFLVIVTVLVYSLVFFTEWSSLSKKARAFDQALRFSGGGMLVSIPYTGVYNIDGKEFYLNGNDQVKLLKSYEIIRNR